MERLLLFKPGTMGRFRFFALLIALAQVAAAAAPQPGLTLASVYRRGIDVTRYWVSEKLDGVRARWDGSALHSRRGNRFNAPPWFVEGFPNVPLDGELWAGRGTFEMLSGIVRRTRPDDDAWRRVRFMVFDLPADPADFNAGCGVSGTCSPAAGLPISVSSNSFGSRTTRS